jgi:hypothetical protein
MSKRSIQIQEALYCGIDVSAKSLAVAVCHDLAALSPKREISPSRSRHPEREKKSFDKRERILMFHFCRLELSASLYMPVAARRRQAYMRYLNQGCSC